MKQKRTITIIAVIFLSICAWAQETAHQKEDILKEARHLKSIYKLDQAAEILASGMKDDEIDEDILSELADCHFQKGSYDNASFMYIILEGLAPRNIQYKVRHMQSEYRQDAFDKAARIGMEIARLDTIPMILSLTGDAFNKMAQSDSALKYYNLAIQSNPFNASVVSKTAKLHLDLEEYDKALEIADRYLELDPGNTSVAPIKGAAHYLRKEFKDAVAVFSDLQDNMGFANFSTHYYLGLSLCQLGLGKPGAEELKLAWQIDSSQANLAYRIALAEEMSHADPVPWLDKAYEMLQPDPAMISSIKSGYADHYHMMNDPEKALPYYLEAYSFNPERISLLNNIAYCYELMKDYKKAKEYFERYLKVGKPGTQGYEYAEEELEYVKGELFMEEK